MDTLINLIENNTIPVLSAFLLGLITAISPCPLATNITAIGFISKDIENRNRVFYNGLVYTLGRSVSYVVLAAFIFYGADQFKIAGFFQLYGEKIIGPLLILIGVFMLDIIKLNIPGLSFLSDKMEKRGVKSYWRVLLLGMVFALAFCPYSGVLFFGMLIPLTIHSGNAIIHPFVFAIATGIPVLLFAWLIAYSISSVGAFYDKIKAFEFWFRKIIAILFILIGIYYIIIIYFGFTF